MNLTSMFSQHHCITNVCPCDFEAIYMNIYIYIYIYIYIASQACKRKSGLMPWKNKKIRWKRFVIALILTND